MSAAMTTLDPVLSRPVALDAIPEGGLSMTVEATPSEREALRALNDLVAVDAVRAEVTLRRAGRHGLSVSGRVEAGVTRTCVVTMEPFPAAVDEPFAVEFLQSAALERWRAEHPADPEEAADEPDEILDDRVDVGVLVAECFTLGLDPYPKKPGARFEEVAPDLSLREDSPFAVLKALRPDGA